MDILRGIHVKHESCDGCAAYLGGGCCRDNLEAECAAGNYELWRETNEEDTGRN